MLPSPAESGADRRSGGQSAAEGNLMAAPVAEAFATP